MDEIKRELLKSVKYVIPIILIFLGVLILENSSSIYNFVSTNISTVNNLLAPFFIGFMIAYILNQPMKYLESKFKTQKRNIYFINLWNFSTYYCFYMVIYNSNY